MFYIHATTEDEDGCSEIAWYQDVDGDGYGNPVDIVDLTPLFSISSVADELTIYTNENLKSLTGLNNITSVGDLYGSDNGYVLSIESNTSLQNFCAISNLIQNGTYYTVNISLNEYNPTIQNLIDGDCAII